MDAPTSCLDALEISLLFCCTLTCNCLLKAMCPLKSALKMGAYQILILQPGYKNVSSGNVNPLKFEKKK